MPGIESDTCAVEGCERPRKRIAATGKRYRLCNAHRKRLDRAGDVRADVPVGRAAPPDRPCTYNQAHKRVQTFRGKASEHACVDCGDAAHEWSYPGGAAHEFSGTVQGYDVRWSGDPNDYEPRCRSCHRRLDRERKRSAA